MYSCQHKELHYRGSKLQREFVVHRLGNDTAGGSKRKRLDGGGRQVNNPDLDVHLAEWIGQGRENGQGRNARHRRGISRKRRQGARTQN
uniref:Uncharacterized protein n=1 Tax=Ditylenchus dipsaci TaxID=166011 RepID=A0A915DNV1_9BILA